MRHILILTLIAICICVFPVVAEEPKWVDPQEKTLRLEEFITRDKFLIEAANFYDGSVLLTVYWNGTKIDSHGMRINESWNVSNNEKIANKEKIINITIKDVREDIGNISAQLGLNVIVDQWVRVETRMAGEPLPLMSIVPEEKHTNNRTIVNRLFNPYSEVSINFTIKNNGKDTLKDPKLKINASLSLLFPGDKLNHELTDIGPGNDTTVNMRFRSPYVGYIGKGKNFTISANVTGKDVFGRKYSSNETIYVVVKHNYDDNIELKKFVSERVYMGDIVIVSLHIKNNMFIYGVKNVVLTDRIPEGFEILNGGNGGIISKNNISWNVTLNSTEKIILYKMRPKTPGIYPLERACIDDMSEIVCSDIPNKMSDHRIIASGPYVELTKNIDKRTNRNGEIEIKVYVKNKGDRSAIVKLVDYIPKNHIINGNNSYSDNNGNNSYSDNNGNNSYSDDGSNESNFDKVFKTMVIRPQDVEFLSYTLVANGDNREYKLPPAKATVLDRFLYLEDRYTQKVVSNSLIINNR